MNSILTSKTSKFNYGDDTYITYKHMNEVSEHQTLITGELLHLQP